MKTETLLIFAGITILIIFMMRQQAPAAIPILSNGAQAGGRSTASDIILASGEAGADILTALGDLVEV